MYSLSERCAKYRCSIMRILLRARTTLIEWPRPTYYMRYIYIAHCVNVADIRVTLKPRLSAQREFQFVSVTEFMRKL